MGPRGAAWWALANVFAAQVALHVVTLKRDGFDGGPPRYGFPLPWRWAGPNSFEVGLCPPAWAVGLLTYTLALAPLFILAARVLRASGRVVALVALVLAGLVTGLEEGLPAVMGWAQLEWQVPREPGARSLAWGWSLDRQ